VIVAMRQDTNWRTGRTLAGEETILPHPREEARRRLEVRESVRSITRDPWRTPRARPGGNVTGFSLQAGRELEAKRLQLLKEAAPTLARVGYLAIKGDWDDVNGKALQIAAQHLGMTLFLVEHGLADYAEAFRALESEPPDGLVVAHWTSSDGSRFLISRSTDGSRSLGLETPAPVLAQAAEVIE
jgi:hypothetical protein